MLNHLSTDVKDIPCTDETKCNSKWMQKAAEQLAKLICNFTASLESVLTLAVGARVMLRHYVSTKQGLVNGAIVSIAQSSVTVQFDHITKPYHVEKVKSKFMVGKKLFVY